MRLLTTVVLAGLLCASAGSAFAEVVTKTNNTLAPIPTGGTGSSTVTFASGDFTGAGVITVSVHPLVTTRA